MTSETNFNYLKNENNEDDESTTIKVPVVIVTVHIWTKYFASMGIVQIGYQPL